MDLKQGGSAKLIFETRSVRMPQQNWYLEVHYQDWFLSQASVVFSDAAAVIKDAAEGTFADHEALEQPQL